MSRARSTTAALAVGFASLCEGLGGCGNGSGGQEGTCGTAALIVAASDYASSAVGGAPREGRATLATGLDLGKDPGLAVSQGRYFYLARDNDLIFELDPACGTAVGRFSVHEASARGAANPHDVAVAADGTLFVPLYNTPRLLTVKDGAVSGSIDLSAYDPDGNPQADAIAILQVDGAEKAFVTLERLDDTDRLRAKQRSQMLRVDVATRRVEAALDLAGKNPFNRLVPSDAALLFAAPGDFDAADETDGGIVRFDPATSSSRLLVTERDLGGSVAEIAVWGRCGAAIVAGATPDVNPTSLVTFEVATGAVVAKNVLGPTPGYDLQGLAYKDGSLYVGDRRPVGGSFRVHVLDTNGEGCAMTPSSRTIELPQRPVALRAAR